jgi:hypothetical protein
MGLNLEKEYQSASVLVSQYMALVQGQENVKFDHVAYIKQMREIRQQLRREMMVMGIADQKAELRVAPEIRALALELDKAMTLHSAQGDYLMEYNASFQLYDLIRDYKGDPEKDVSVLDEEEDFADQEDPEAPEALEDPEAPEKVPAIPKPPKGKPGRPPVKKHQPAVVADIDDNDDEEEEDDN